MELEHRFEVPVGIDRAWGHLLDMEKVAACFPGATLTSADGSEYSGSVRVKLGPIQLTYGGSARITEADEDAHSATIEASGSAPRSGSTATMKVIATASSIAADRTSVTMLTDLAVTGRPAQFGRGVMAEVGGKILGKFSECLADALADEDSGPSHTSKGDEAAAMSVAAAPPQVGVEPIDLFASSREAVMKRIAPLVVLVLLGWMWRRRRHNRVGLG